MLKLNVKKLFALCCAFCLTGFSLQAQEIRHYDVMQSDYSGVNVRFTAGVLQQETYKNDGDIYAILAMQDFGLDGHIGQPALPALVKIVEIPLGGDVSYRILAMDADTIDGALLDVSYPVMPQQPSRHKSDRTPFVLQKDAQAYATNGFLGYEPIRVNKIGVARDRNLAEVHFSPLRYNPVTNQFILVRSVEVSIQVKNADLSATQEMKQRYHSPAFGVGNDVINRLPMPKDVRNAAPLRYLIVTHTMFQRQLDDFIQWKRRQGFLVDLAITNGSVMLQDNSLSLKDYIKQQYTNATEERPAPTYVLFVGDVEQIPAANTYSGSTDGGYVTDLDYFTWTDGDNLPDCYYGRFSAQSLSELTPQIEKTLMYEQYAFPDDGFLSRAALISGVDGGYTSDNAYKYCDPTMNYIAKLYVNPTNGFDTIAYYKNNTSHNTSNVPVTGSCQSSSTASALRSFYNDGFGWVNYSAHGDIQEWYSPSFTNSHVSGMTNTNKFGIMIGSCCLTNHFQTTTCFGEALLRKGNNAGAVAYVGGTDVTYWYEDFVWAVGMRSSSSIGNTYDAPYSANNLGMYDRLFHTHDEDFDQWHTSMGSMIYAGNMAVQASSSSRKLYYWRIYSLMGDPSLMPWLGRAETMTPVHDQVIVPGTSEFQVSVPAHAYVAMTLGDSLLAAAFADENGMAVLQLPAIAPGNNPELAVIAQNYKPYFSTLNVISPDGPFLLVDSLVCTSALATGDTVRFDAYLRNVGTVDVQDISMSVALDNNTMYLLSQPNVPVEGTVAVGGSIRLENAVQAYVWPTAGNEAASRATLTVMWRDGDTSGRYSCATTFKVKAPVLQVAQSTYTISDGSNFLPLVVENSGALALGDAKMIVTSPSDILTVVVDTISLASIAPQGQGTLQLELLCDENAPAQFSMPLDVLITDGTFSYRTVIQVQKGVSSDDFETGDFSKLSWSNQSNYPWVVDNSEKHGGSYSVRSYRFDDDASNVTSSLTLQWNVSNADSISFWYKVSSEQNYDEFVFYMDGAAMLTVSGDGEWTRAAFPVAVGSHTFVFSYEKDGSVNRNSDCVWIDDLQLPFSSTQRYLFDTICQGSDYVYGETTVSAASLAVGNHDVSFEQEGVSYSVRLAVVETPVVAIHVYPEADVYAAATPITLAATGAGRYVWSSGEQVPQLWVCPQATVTYTVTGYNGTCSAQSSVTLNVNSDSVSIVDAEMPMVSLYPNPTVGKVVVASNEALSQIVLYNTLGQAVLRNAAQGVTATLDLQQLPQGVYMLQLTMSDGRVISKKILKK